MGWMSWERFGCQKDCTDFPDECISAKLFEDMANQLTATGLKAAGYNRIDIDDCYLAKRDPVTNDLVADPDRFPGGITALSDKLHEQGFKFGVYNDIGRTTCAGNPGLNVSEADDPVADAQLKRDCEVMANEWKIDSIKIDGCARRAGSNMSVTYPKLGKYLNATGRQILFTCSWPVYTSLAPDCNGSLATPGCFPVEQIVPACSTWRVFKDIMDAYNLPGHAGVRQIIDFYAHNNASLRAASGPGHYNDYDMLLAGDAGLSVAEAKIQFGMWAMWSAPLLMSNDLRTIDQEFIDILTAEEVIAVDQDPLGASAEGIIIVNNSNVMSAQVSVWHKPLEEPGARAAALLNTGLFDASSYNLTVTSEMLGLGAAAAFTARDLFARKDLGTFDGEADFWLAPTSITMLLVKPVKTA